MSARELPTLTPQCWKAGMSCCAWLFPLVLGHSSNSGPCAGKAVLAWQVLYPLHYFPSLLLFNVFSRY